MDLNEYIRQSYKRPNRKVLEGLGASEELIEYLMETPWNTNMKVVESLISKGSGDDKPGIKSITISPALETIPALDSLAPIYYDDLTEDQKQNGIVFDVNTDEQSTDFVLTVTPTSNWHGYNYSGEESVRLDDGEPMTVSGNTNFETPFEVYGDDEDIKFISVTIRFNAKG